MEKPIENDGDDKSRPYPNEVYKSAADELLLHIRLRHNLLLLGVTAHLALFGLALKYGEAAAGHSGAAAASGAVNYIALLIVPHVSFVITMLYTNEHNEIGALFGYMRDLGSEEKEFVVRRTNAWYAHPRFYGYLTSNFAHTKRFIARSLLIQAPAFAALYLYVLLIPAFSGSLYWYFGLGAACLSCLIHWQAAGSRDLQYEHFREQAVRPDSTPESERAYRVFRNDQMISRRIERRIIFFSFKYSWAPRIILLIIFCTVYAFVTFETAN